MRTYYVYVLASLSHVLYIGVTNDLRRRVWEHKNALRPGFTRDYRVTRLMYFETFTDIRCAIEREKQLKRLGRRRKVRMIEEHNPDWRDLSVDWFHE